MRTVKLINKETLETRCVESFTARIGDKMIIGLESYEVFEVITYIDGRVSSVETA